MTTVLPAELVGIAKHDPNGWLTIGLPNDPKGQVRINLNAPGNTSVAGWCASGEVHVYVRRSSSDLSVMEVHMVRHDGNAQEQLDEQNRQADAYPLGVKEYWRSEIVGKYTNGPDRHLVTDEEFEQNWSDEEDGVD